MLSNVMSNQLKNHKAEIDDLFLSPSGHFMFLTFSHYQVIAFVH